MLTYIVMLTRMPPLQHVVFTVLKGSLSILKSMSKGVMVQSIRNIYDTSWVLQPFTVDCKENTPEAVIEPCKMHKMVELI